MQTAANSPDTASRIFAPIAHNYERWARILSMDQDRRWRETMVEGLRLRPSSHVLDVASGTGSITRLLETAGHEVVSLDQSPDMITRTSGTRVLATAEHLPFPDATFDGVTYGYLLRYVNDLEGCLSELARVLRPGGRMGMVEFGRPAGVFYPPWWLYTRIALPLAGAIARSGWYEVGRFLGPSIEAFHRDWPQKTLSQAWSRAGFSEINHHRMSLGGGLLMWGTRR